MSTIKMALLCMILTVACVALSYVQKPLTCLRPMSARVGLNSCSKKG